MDKNILKNIEYYLKNKINYLDIYIFKYFLRIYTENGKIYFEQKGEKREVDRKYLENFYYFLKGDFYGKRYKKSRKRDSEVYWR